MMHSGHLVEVTTLLVSGQTRQEFYGVCNEDCELARELVVAACVITSDQTVRDVATLATPVLASLGLMRDEVRYFGMSETMAAPVLAQARELLTA